MLDHSRIALEDRLKKENVLRKLSSKEKKAKKADATRLALIEAAGKIIGRYGYSNCSIARVTARAKIAHGAFYLYFSSRQALFDQVHPTLAGRMLAFIANAIKDTKGIYELELKSLRASFAYLEKNPHMYRVLQEAEPYVPTAFAQYQDNLRKSYARSLRHALGIDLPDANYELLATMLIGARTQLTRYYSLRDHVAHPLPNDIYELYARFAASGAMAATMTALGSEGTESKIVRKG
jgi:AcrR family transcriptional regulator